MVIPSHDTFERVFARILPTCLEDSLHLVRRRLPGGDETPKHIALDGEEVCGSQDSFHDSPAAMLLSAYATDTHTDTHLVLAQKKVDAKSNEIPAAVEVLRHPDLDGAARQLAAAARGKSSNYLYDDLTIVLCRREGA